MKNRLSLTVGTLFFWCVCSIKAGIREDLEAANQIPDEQWVEKAKAFTEAFENLKVKLQEQWRIQLGDGECGFPINGVPPSNYNPNFIDKRGAVKQDSPVWLGCWLSGHLLKNTNHTWILGCAKPTARSFLSPEKKGEVVGCCTPYRWEAACCSENAKFTHLISILFFPCNLGFWEVLGYALTDEDSQMEAYIRHVKHAVKRFIFTEFGVSNLQQAGDYLQRSFCTPVANLILKLTQEEIAWNKDNLLVLLSLYCSYVSCDAGIAAQDHFAQYKYNDVRHAIHQLLARVICISQDGNHELNVWLVKQLANWKNDPYSETLAGIGQYQVEIEFLLECAAKLKAQEGASIAQNIQNSLNIVIDEVIKNKTERTRYRHQESEINNAYLIGLAMRNGAGI